MASGWIRMIFPIHGKLRRTNTKRIKSRILPCLAIVVVGAAAVTAYCYPNKITQNLISLLRNPKWLPRYVWCMSLRWQSWRTSEKKIINFSARSTKCENHTQPSNEQKKSRQIPENAQTTTATEKKGRENDNGKKNEWESARETMTLNLLILEYYIYSEFILCWYELKRISFFFFCKWHHSKMRWANIFASSWYSSFTLCRQNERCKSFRMCVCIHFFAAAATFAVVLRMNRKSGKKALNAREYEQWHTVWMSKVTTANGIPLHSELRARPHWDSFNFIWCKNLSDCTMI